MAATVEIVELRFCDRIVHVDRGNEQLVFLVHLIKTMHAGRCFLRNAAPIFHDLVPAIWILALDLEQQIFDDLLFFICRVCLGPIAAFFELVTFVNEQRRVAAVIDHELGTLAVRMRNRLVSTPPICFK